jgi:hypothetical protein
LPASPAHAPVRSGRHYGQPGCLPAPAGRAPGLPCAMVPRFNARYRGTAVLTRHAAILHYKSADFRDGNSAIIRSKRFWTNERALINFSTCPEALEPLSGRVFFSEQRYELGPIRPAYGHRDRRNRRGSGGNLFGDEASSDRSVAIKKNQAPVSRSRSYTARGVHPAALPSSFILSWPEPLSNFRRAST